jgi:hypothetical protein
MVQKGSHQEAMGQSTNNFRLLGETHQANVVLRRNLAAVSGARAAHFTLHPDGTARAVDDCEPGTYPIEEILKEGVDENGQTKFFIAWAGPWRGYDKYVWVDESACLPADVVGFRLDQQIKACELSDINNGISAINTPPTTRHTRSKVITGRVQKSRSGRRGNTKPRPDRIFKALTAAFDRDCEYEDISREEQAFYAARSAFKR